jgi:hypothetical protein
VKERQTMTLNLDVVNIEFFSNTMSTFLTPLYFGEHFGEIERTPRNN